MSLAQQKLQSPLARASPESAAKDQEDHLRRLYGGLPARKKTLLCKTTKDRKYFDSGDYAMAKAGKGPSADLGTEVPSPQTIPHSSCGTNYSSGGSPPGTSPISMFAAGPPLTKSSSLVSPPSSYEDAPAAADFRR